MRTRLLGTITIAALALAACGGDDAGGGDGDGSVQDQVADMMIAGFNEASEVEGVDVEVDEDCVRDVVGELSDEDAQAILDAGMDGDPDVSDEAEEIGGGMLECVNVGDIDLGELDTDG